MRACDDSSHQSCWPIASYVSCVFTCTGTTSGPAFAEVLAVAKSKLSELASCIPSVLQKGVIRCKGCGSVRSKYAMQACHCTASSPLSRAKGLAFLAQHPDSSQWLSAAALVSGGAPAACVGGARHCTALLAWEGHGTSDDAGLKAVRACDLPLGPVGLRPCAAGRHADDGDGGLKACTGVWRNEEGVEW